MPRQGEFIQQGLATRVPRPCVMGGQATYIAPLQPTAFAAVKPWRIRKELAVQDLPIFDVCRSVVGVFPDRYKSLSH